MFKEKKLEAFINECIESLNDENTSSYSFSYSNNNGDVSINADLNGKKISASSVEEFLNKSLCSKLTEKCNDPEKEEKPKTVILNGLEWMTENLTGHGGIKAGDNTYFSRGDAQYAAIEVGDGWRLPTYEEFEALTKIESSWNDEKKGRWFGKNKELFLPSSGFLMRENIDSNNGILKDIDTWGEYWACTDNITYAPYFGTCFQFSSNDDETSVGGAKWWHKLSVRLVRDIPKKEETPEKEEKKSETVECCQCNGPEWFSKSVIFGGLEWMGTNLSGLGGTEVDGNWYYTLEQAEKALANISALWPHSNWRLPTRKELYRLINTEHEYSGDHITFGKNHKLSLPCLGHLNNNGELLSKGFSGWYWKSANDGKGIDKNIFYFNCISPTLVDVGDVSGVALTIRLVRDIK